VPRMSLYLAGAIVLAAIAEGGGEAAGVRRGGAAPGQDQGAARAANLQDVRDGR